MAGSVRKSVEIAIGTNVSKLISGLQSVQTKLGQTQQSVEDLQKQADRGATVEVNVDDKATSDLVSIEGRVREVDGSTPTVEVTADVDQATSRVDLVKRQIDGLSGEDAKVVIDANITALEQKIGKAKKEITDLDAEDVKLQVQVIGNGEAQLKQLKQLADDLDNDTISPSVDVKGVDAFKDKIDLIPGRVGEIGSSFGALPGGGIAAAAGAVGAVGLLLKEAVDTTAQLGSDVGLVSSATGGSVEAASRLVQAFGSAGIETSDLLDMVNQVNGVLSQTPEIATRLGITVGQDALQNFRDVAAAVERLPAGFDRSVLAASLFGEEGVRQIAAIESQSGSLEKALAGVKPLFSRPEDLQAVKEYQAQLTQVQTLFQKTFVEAGKLIIPVVTGLGQVGDGLGNVLSGLGPVGDALKAAFEVSGVTAVVDLADAIDDLADAAEDGGKEVVAFVGAIVDKLKELKGDASDAAGPLGGVVDLVADAASVSGVSAFGDVLGAIGDGLGDLGGALSDGDDALAQYGSSVRAARGELEDVEGGLGQYGASLRAAGVEEEDLAGQHAAETKALGELYDSLQTAAGGYDAAAGAAGAFSSVASGQVSAMFDIHQGAADAEEGIAGLGEALKTSSQEFKDGGFHLSSLDDEGRKLLDTTEQLAGTIQTSLTAELKNAGGDYDAVRTKASSYRDELIGQMGQLGLTSEQQQDYLKFLNLTPDQVETTIKLSKDEEARQKLQLLKVDADKLGEPITTEYNALVAAGEYQAALDLLANAAAPGGDPRTAQFVTSTDTSELNRVLDAAAHERFVHFTTLSPKDSLQHGALGTSNLRPKRMAGGGMVPVTVGEKGQEDAFLPEGTNIVPNERTRMYYKQAARTLGASRAVQVTNVSLDMRGAIVASERQFQNMVTKAIRTTVRRNGPIT